jgi:hypothetical protein
MWNEQQRLWIKKPKPEKKKTIQREPVNHAKKRS